MPEPLRRLLRPEIIRDLARLARRWNKLSYPRFVIQAEREINPEHDNDPDSNFSVAESVAGFITPIPVRYRTPNTDIRTFFDYYHRPDKYAVHYFNNIRLRWNLDIVNNMRMIYCFTYKIMEKTKRTETLVRHRYLQTLRGINKVRELDAGYVNSITGFEERREAIQASANIRAVDRNIDQVIAENEHIQNGGI